MEAEIKFITGYFNHEVTCYLKIDKYDVYLDGKCVRVNATIDWINEFKKIITKPKVGNCEYYTNDECDCAKGYCSDEECFGNGFKLKK